jgi:hypothetical protein
LVRGRYEVEGNALCVSRGIGVGRGGNLPRAGAEPEVRLRTARCAWCSAFLWLLRKLTVRHGAARRLVLKSPVHTARVALLHFRILRSTRARVLKTTMTVSPG